MKFEMILNCNNFICPIHVRVILVFCTTSTLPSVNTSHHYVRNLVGVIAWQPILSMLWFNLDTLLVCCRYNVITYITFVICDMNVCKFNLFFRKCDHVVSSNEGTSGKNVLSPWSSFIHSNRK